MKTIKHCTIAKHCTIKQCLELKTLGFNIPVSTYCWKIKEFKKTQIYKSVPTDWNNVKNNNPWNKNISNNFLSIPSLDEAIEFMRDRHKIFISISFVIENGNLLYIGQAEDMISKKLIWSKSYYNIYVSKRSLISKAISYEKKIRKGDHNKKKIKIWSTDRPLFKN